MVKVFIEKKVVDSVSRRFPELCIAIEERKRTYSEFNVEKVEEYSIILVSNLPDSPDTILTMRDSCALEFITRVTDGLKGIRLVPQKAALLKDNLFFGIIEYSDIPERKLFNKDFSLSSTLVFEDFVIKHEKIDFHIQMGGLIIRPDKAWDLIEPTSSRVDFSNRSLVEAATKERSEKFMRTLTKPELDLVWDANINSLLLGFSDSRPVGLDFLCDSFIDYLPPLNDRSSNFIFITPQKEEDTDLFMELMIGNWEEIVNSAVFAYYEAHGAMVYITDMISGEPEPLELAPRHRFLSDDPILEAVPHRLIRSEALQYISVAESSHLQSFRFLSFYHILESFFEEVNVESVSKEAKKILLSLDLQQQVDYYAAKIAELVTQFTFPHQTDEDRLSHLIERFIPFLLIEKILTDDVRSILKKRVTFDGGLTLDSVNLTHESRFFTDLTRRIYLLRNAIVHSKRHAYKKRGRVSFSTLDQNRIEAENQVMKLLVSEIVSRAGLMEPHMK